MYIKNIKLQNFRNYNECFLEFDKNLNLFLGSNAQGKTNLLESLFIMGLGKSFRTNKDEEMIAFNEDFSKATSVVVNEDNKETEIEVLYSKEGKTLKVDGGKLDRTVDLIGNCFIVVFSPDDLKIIKEGPDNRRRYLDRELCQIKPIYYSDLGNYKKVLKQRNMMLRQNDNNFALFDVFDEALADYGLRVVAERKKFVKRIEEISNKIHSEITCKKEDLRISYETKILDWDNPREEYKKLLEENFEKDIYKGYTSFGPHKDDLKIEINGTDIRCFGSQGQQRTAALSMKLAELGLIKQETGSNAVLLLDDVMSELDSDRQKYLIEAMKGVQVFVTSASMDKEVLKELPKGKTFFIEGGKVLTENG